MFLVFLQQRQVSRASKSWSHDWQVHLLRSACGIVQNDASYKSNRMVMNDSLSSWGDWVQCLICCYTHVILCCSNLAYWQMRVLNKESYGQTGSCPICHSICTQVPTPPQQHETPTLNKRRFVFQRDFRFDVGERQKRYLFMEIQAYKKPRSPGNSGPS